MSECEEEAEEQEEEEEEEDGLWDGREGGEGWGEEGEEVMKVSTNQPHKFRRRSQESCHRCACGARRRAS